MSANSDLANTAANDAKNWPEKANIAANDSSQATTAPISEPDAFGALADAVMAFIQTPTRLKDRRRAVITMSELLREAFSLRATTLAPLPKQLGANHDAAADYIYDQMDRWAVQPALSKLFDAIKLGDDVRSAIIVSLMRRVPAEDIGLWLSTEFGGLTAAREAEHCRRYVSTKISAALFDLSAAQPSVDVQGTKALQRQLDDWATPTGTIEQSLHFQMVIAPFLSFFHDIATGRVAKATR